MASDMCTRRLTKELASLRKEPIHNPVIRVAPNEANILEMHYVIEGSKGTPYEGGFYHGKLVFPKEYPLKPPSVMMLTPSGRFQPNRRLCLSMSDFHPESWNPMWSVSTILTGLYSFMVENGTTLGSIETTTSQKRKFARQSLDFNVRDTNFCKLFPEYVELQKERAELRRLAMGESGGVATTTTSQEPSTAVGMAGENGVHGIVAYTAGIVALLSIVFAMLRFI